MDEAGGGEGAAGPCALNGLRALEVEGRAWSATWLKRRSQVIPTAISSQQSACRVLPRTQTSPGDHMPGLLTTFRPRPGCYPPPVAELAESNRRGRASLRDLLAIHFKSHGCWNYRICAKPKLAEEVKFLSANDKTQSPSGDTCAQMYLLCLSRHIFDIVILRCFLLGERCRSHYLSGSEGRIAFRVQ